MHGRVKVRSCREIEEEQEVRDREKAYHFAHMAECLLNLRPRYDEERFHDEIFNLSAELLLIIPDFYTAWNMRRETLLIHTQDMHQDQVDSIFRGELDFTMECLNKNEKSYSVWQHRIWCLSHLPLSVYESELILCTTFLAKDERNFHCWDYRKYICEVSGVPLESEFDYTTEKIKANFSNFSAWHRRHKILEKFFELPEDECPESCNLKLMWTEEYNMILNALFTDPSDQSPWLYHNWLIKNNFGHLGKEQLDKLEMLEGLEPDNRWIKQAVALTKKQIETTKVNN